MGLWARVSTWEVQQGAGGCEDVQAHFTPALCDKPLISLPGWLIAHSFDPALVQTRNQLNCYINNRVIKMSN